MEGEELFCLGAEAFEKTKMKSVSVCPERKPKVLPLLFIVKEVPAVDSYKLEQSVINMMAIHLDQTGHEEMEIAEIASHLKVSVEVVEMAVLALVETDMARMSIDNRFVKLLKKGYGRAQ